MSASKKTNPSFTQLVSLVTKILPDALIEENEEGELIIFTNLQQVGKDNEPLDTYQGHIPR